VLWNKLPTSADAALRSSELRGPRDDWKVKTMSRNQYIPIFWTEIQVQAEHSQTAGPVHRARHPSLHPYSSPKLSRWPCWYHQMAYHLRTAAARSPGCSSACRTASNSLSRTTDQLWLLGSRTPPMLLWSLGRDEGRAWR